MTSPAPPVPAPAPAPPAATPVAAAGPAPAPSPLSQELARPVVPAGVPAEEVELLGGAAPAPPEPVARYLEDGEGRQVSVRAGTHRGLITLHRKANGYVIKGPQWIPLARHPLLDRLGAAGVVPVLSLSTTGSGLVRGQAAVVVKGRLRAGPDELLDALAANAGTLGWPGLDRLKFGTPAVNELQGPSLVLRADGLRFGIGGFLQATGSFGIAGDRLTVDVTATGKVGPLGPVGVTITLGPDGALTGSGTVDVNIKGLTGTLTAAYAGGAVDVRGVARYANEKLDGEVTVVATDAATAEELTASHTPEKVVPVAPAATPAAAGPKPGPRVLVGWGTVRVQLADWLTGDAQVVVDGKGHVHVVGAITPRMDKPLFEQRDYIKALPKLEARALYGLPVVGNVFVFASVGIEVLAKLGPATLKDMALTGTWSTDPDVLKSLQLTGTLNVSAFAGIRLTASGGVGLEVLDHDIKAGVALSALAGIRGYVEARPTIGYREVADPQAGKRGEFFIAGHMEIAAQPFLGLGGELFVELDSPWWSPAPDKRWPWPIGQLEYPLPGEFGIGADVEHVLGSGTVPEVTFGEVDFSADKFMTDLMSDHVPPKKAVEEQKAGTWNEGAPAGGAADPVVTGAAPPAPAEGAKGKQDPADGDVPKPSVEQRWLAGMKALGELAEAAKANPQDRGELDVALAGIKQKHGFTSLTADLSGENWLVDATMNPGMKDLPVPAAPAAAGEARDKVGGEDKQVEGRVVQAFHGAPGNRLLSIINDGVFKPSEGKIFLSRSEFGHAFMHGGDRARGAAFVVKLELTFSPEDVRAKSTSTAGVPDTLLLETDRPVPVKVLELYVRERDPDADEGEQAFVLSTFSGAAEIVDRLNRDGPR